MKKMSKLLALLIAVLMVASIQLPAMAVEIGDKVTEDIPSLKNLDALGSSFNSSQLMAENDKYIFVVIGSRAHRFRYDSALQIFDKTTGELIKTVTLLSNYANSNFYCPVRDMYVKDDILFVSWGNAVVDKESTYRPKVPSGYETFPYSPIMAYDVSEVTEISPLKEVITDQWSEYKKEYAPFNWGGFSYLDEDNSVLYTSGFFSSLPGTRCYSAYTIDEVRNGLEGTATALSKTRRFKNTDPASMNTAKFMIKDGWFFEVLQQNGGLENGTTIAYDGTKKLATNNQVRVYDVRDLDDSINCAAYGTAYDLKDKLRGTYTTDVTDDVAIRDIEVVGDYMYVATTAGIEVVSLATAKAQDATTSTVLTDATTVKKEGFGGVADLDVVDGYLFAGYTGPEYYGAPNSTSAAGAVVAYDIATTPDAPTVAAEQSVDYGVLEISVNETENKVYVLNDVMGPPAMAAFAYTPDPAVEGEFEFTAIKLGDSETVVAGTRNISVELSNPAPATTGTLICAVYEGNKLADVFVKPDYSGNGAVTMAENYPVTEAVTEVKAMFLDSLTGELRPLIPALSIGK